MNTREDIPLPGVMEYAEGMQVSIVRHKETGRLVIQALNEGGFNLTLVDVLQLIEALRVLKML